jgi:rhamnose transport system ATP-binding protein
VVLARQLVERPGVLVLEEPTQGVDVGAKEEIHKQILALADQGTAVLVVSSDLLEVLELADRVLVVRAGTIVAEFGRGASQADVLAAAAGDESGEGTMLDSARAAVAQEVDTR